MSETLQNQIQYNDVLRKGGFAVSMTLPGATAATAANYCVFFTAPRAVDVFWASETHRVGTATGTLQLEILDPGEALDAGDTVLTTAWDLNSTVNTPVNKQGTDFTVNRTIKPGQRLALKDGGSVASCADVSVTVYFRFTNKGDFF